MRYQLSSLNKPERLCIPKKLMQKKSTNVSENDGGLRSIQVSAMILLIFIHFHGTHNLYSYSQKFIDLESSTGKSKGGNIKI